ncbi:membrane protein [Terrabacter tumescens]|uniref:Membrane protein n=1 Tax=Terrabacter tumescens TaxID=60443 RepID=A0ABQ2IEE9_9MICO|nr:MFS transporter [Terrabacter tumescens]GGN06677.1 membrane protein [Terrabacter tumescens]
MKTYRQLFAVREFRVLFVVQCLNVGSYAVASLALGTITFAATASPVLTALAMFGAPLMRLVGQTLFGSGSDLVRPRTALVLVASTTMVTDLLQALPGLGWGWRFALLAVGPLITSALGGSMMALVSDILPPDGFILGRATMNIAVGGMQIVGYGIGGLLLITFTTTQLFLGAGAALFVAVLLLRLGLSDHPPRHAGASLVRRTREVNRALLGSRVVRPLLLTMWVPNGLIVGCEALFVPFAGEGAGYLFAVTAAGMLIGDVVVGRFLDVGVRDRLIGPLRLLLAVPYLAFFLVPSLPYAASLAFVASVGYSASLPLQERLVSHTDGQARGQVFGLQGTGLMVGQALGALLGGAVASGLGVGPVAAAHAMGVMAVASVVVSLAVTPGLRRSRPGAGVLVGASTSAVG